MEIFFIIIVFFIILIFIYEFNIKNKNTKNDETIIHESVDEKINIDVLKDEEYHKLDLLRQEKRKQKLEQEKQLISEWQKHNIKIFEKEEYKQIHSNYDFIHEELSNYYLLEKKNLTSQIFFDNYNLREINLNIEYYNDLILTVTKLESELEEKSNEVLFKNYIKALKAIKGKVLLRSNYKFNIRYFFLFDYLSNYTLNTIHNDIYTYKEIRTLIFNFKKGIFHQNLSKILVYSILSEDFNIYNNKEYCICVIPASNIKNNTNRYCELLEILSNKLKIINGFNFIKRQHNIKSSLSNGVKTTINVLDGIVFSDELIGKNVILLDDVITKGNSLNNFNNKLIQFGAKNVFPLFIAKTYYSSNNAKDDLDLDFNMNNLSFIKFDSSELNDILRY